MKTLSLMMIMSLSLAAPVAVEEAEPSTQPSQPAVRFEAVDIYIDPGGKPLGAYQFELAAETGTIAIVGVEGGQHSAYRQPPYYDPAALMNNRIIIAAFNTGKNLPTAKTRVARLHLQITGRVEPEYGLKLIVAADNNGKPLAAKITVEQGEAQ